MTKQQRFEKLLRIYELDNDTWPDTAADLADWCLKNRSLITVASPPKKAKP
jgi:hypothetical protein